MEFTGERVVPGQVDADLWQEHVSRYEFARRLIPLGASVLDAGCGCGYGTALIAAGTKAVGMDLSAEAIAWAQQNYPGLQFQQGDCTALADPDSSYDAVVAFEVIEHLEQPERFLQEAKRVLRSDGMLLVSTPNRRYYTEERGFRNPFHTREYDAAEFEALLGAHFTHCKILTQNHVPAIRFELPRASMEVGTGDAAQEDSEPYFFMAVCSQTEPKASGFVYLPESGNVLRERERHIHKLEADLAALQAQTNRELAERREWASKLEAELRDKAEFIVHVQTELDRRREWAVQQDTELREKAEFIAQMQREAEARTAWARALEAAIADRDAVILGQQSEVAERTRWAEALDKDIVAARQRIEELDAELIHREAARRQQVDGLEKELDERAAWAHGLNDEIAVLIQRLAGAEAQVATTRQKLDAAHADLRLILGSRWYRAGKRLRLSPIPEVDHHGRQR